MSDDPLWKHTRYPMATRIDSFMSEQERKPRAFDRKYYGRSDTYRVIQQYDKRIEMLKKIDPANHVGFGFDGAEIRRLKEVVKELVDIILPDPS